MRPEILRLAADLSVRGEPFVLATVVWRRSPSSGKEGATALVTRTGEVHGWLGGACAEPTVVREALRVLVDGRPELLFLGPPEELAANRREGVVTVPIACQSEGALEVYMEPVLVQPQVVAVGRSPAARALVGLAAGLGWRALLVGDVGAPDGLPAGARWAATLIPDDVDERSFVVVATQGHYDEDALARALETRAVYIGLVASRKRAASVLGYLRDRGIDAATLARVHAPAGLDLGRTPTDEIAVAVLAEIVSLRASGQLAAGVPVAPSSHHEEIDPVCGMSVEVAGARHRAVHDGRTYYFCAAGCRTRFEADPAGFLPVR
ncbi:MAG: XdhC family protein [Actinomycetota bacterium]